MKKKIVLFDMDGTLTLPREKIQKDVVQALKRLQKHFEIGLVTGSDKNYIDQQLGSIYFEKDLDLNKFHLFPCNGTKRFSWTGNDYEKVYEVDMIQKIGSENYRHILQNVLSYQLLITIKFDLPYTGVFFDYRGSMLNWCPVGRLANKEQRDAWVEADLKFGIRETYLKDLKSEFNKKMIDLDVALGGSTSFDIYPNGWDKTYVVNHLDDYEQMLFVGDKCVLGGNDYTIYTLLSNGNNCQSYSVHNPEDTIRVIDQNILSTFG